MLQYSDFKSISNLLSFNSYSTLFGWSIYCLECDSTSYALKYDYICHLCSTITNCSQCSFRDTNGTDVGDLVKAAQMPIVFSQTTQILLRCLTCSTGFIPTLVLPDNLLTQCQSCSSIISNCNSCSFATMLNNSLVTQTTSWKLLSHQVSSTAFISCISCNSNYGIYNANGTSCQSCPSNCEYCYLNSSSLFCGRCSPNYVLSIYTGTCQTLSSASIPPSYTSQCSQIVLVSPWSSLLTNASQYLCQKCLNSSKFPSITGLCTGCSNQYCSQCSENDGPTSYTNLLITSPISLINLISNTTSPTDLQSCSSCSDPSYGFQSLGGTCCPPQQTYMSQPVPVTKIQYCDACGNQCQTQQSVYICSSCKTCSSVDTNLLNNNSFISKSSESTDYFSKRVYYILLKEAFAFKTSPTLNDTPTYNSLYSNLTSQSRIDLAASSINTCSVCLISGTDCISSSSFSYQKVSSAYNGLTSQLSYNLYNSQCRPGFIYDPVVNRCKFCPNNWTSCDAYKKIEYKFTSTQSSDPFTIQGLQALFTSFSTIQSDAQFSYVLNEFATKSLQIVVSFDPTQESTLTLDQFSYDLSSTLATVIPSLQNFTITFQPLGYDNDPTLMATVNWGVSLSFTGFTHVIFKNLKFNIVPYYLSTSMNVTEFQSQYSSYKNYVPGIYSQSDTLLISSCIFTTWSQAKYLILYPKFYKGDSNFAQMMGSIYGPLDFFSIYTQKISNFSISNVTVTLNFLLNSTIISMFVPFQQDMYFINGNAAVFQSSDLKFINCQVTLLHMVQVSFENSAVSFRESLIEGCFMNSSNFFVSTVSGPTFNITNLLINSSEFNTASFFDVSNAGKILFANVTVSESVFKGTIDSASQTGVVSNLIISNNFVGITVNVLNCQFSYYLFSTVTRDSPLNNYIFSYNDFNVYNSSFFAYNPTILFLSIKLSDQMDMTNKLSFDNITFKDCLYKTTKYFFDVPTFISLSSINAVSLSQMYFLDCYNVSALYGENFQYFAISDFQFINTVRSPYSQIPLILLECFQTIVSNSSFLNIYSSFGIISIDNVIWSPSNFRGMAYFSNVSMANISISSVDVQQISSIVIFSKVALSILVENSNFVQLFINDTSFYQLSPSVLLIDSIESVLIINNTLFSNLTSTNIMNGLYLVIGTLYIVNSKFEYGNFYVKNFSKVNSQGSFINIQTMNLTLINSSFSKVFALFGGVAYVKAIKNAYITVSNSNFDQCYAVDSGGVFYFVTTQASLTDLVFTNNSFFHICAFAQGGVFFMTNIQTYPTYFSLENNNFTNVASKTGAIFAASYLNSLSMKNIWISNNYDSIGPDVFFLINQSFPTYQVVGALFILSNSLLIFNSCNFSSMVASGDDAEIVVGSSIEFEDTFSIYRNISFWKSCFALTSSIVNLKNTLYENISSTVPLNPNDKATTTYPVFYLVSDNYFKASNISAQFIDCSINVGGGGFLYSSASTFSIENSSFLYVASYKGGVIYASGNQLSNSVYLNNSIMNSTFNYCKSIYNGGALLLENTNISINSSQFLFNKAINGSGGAVFYWCPLVTTGMIITQSLFDNNSAYIGGAIYYKNVLINIDNSTIFRNNYAPFYGISKFSYPRKLRVIETQTNRRLFSNTTEVNISSNANDTSPITYYDSSNFSIFNIRSGGDLPNIDFQILDEDGTPLVSLDGQPSISITMEILLNLNGTSNGSEIYSISSSKSISNIELNEKGLIQIPHTTFIAPPPSVAYLRITSSSILVPDSNNLFQDSLYNFTFPVHVRDCIRGELKLSSTTGTCFPCVNGSYSYKTSDAACSSCLEGLDCTMNAGVTFVDYGYWRREYYSEIILPCDNLDANCIGGNTSGDNGCFPGHIGPRCESCDLTGALWNKSYARSSNYQCVDCDTVNYNYIFLAAISIFSFASMVISITGTVANLKYVMQMQFIKKISRFSMISSVEDTSQIYIKIYMTYFQIIQVISELDLPVPNGIKSLSKTVGNPTASALYSTDCFIALFKLALPALYVKLLLSLIVPFLYLGLFTLGYILHSLKKQDPRKYSFLCTVCLFTLIYFQPSVIQALMEALACITIGDRNYIKGDVSYDCYTHEYYLYSFSLGVPFMIIWGIFAPGIVLWRMYVNRNRLDLIKYRIRYGYLCSEYQIFFWEFVKMFEKILITLFLEFYETEIKIKGLLILLIIAIYYSMVIRFQPYKKDYFNKTDKLTSMVCFITIFFGVLSYNNSFTYMVIMSYLIIIIVNVVYNVYILRKIIQSYTSKIEESIEKISEKLIKIKFLKRFLKPKKVYLTLENWRIVRRASARYLRARERNVLRETEQEKMRKTGSLKYALTFKDYDPKNVGYILEGKKKIPNSDGSEDMINEKEKGKDNRRDSELNTLNRSPPPESVGFIITKENNYL